MDTFDFETNLHSNILTGNVYWQQDQLEQTPRIRVDASPVSNQYEGLVTEIGGSRTPTQQFLLPNAQQADARWGSGGSSGSPIIVSSLHDGQTTPNEPPKVRTINMPQMPMMQPLNLDVDPNAWELKNVDLQRLLGNNSGE